MSKFNYIGDYETHSSSASESEASESTLSSNSVSTPTLDVELKYNFTFNREVNETDDLDEHFDPFAYGLDEENELDHNEIRRTLDDSDAQFDPFAYGLEEDLDIRVNPPFDLRNIPVIAQFFADREQCMSPELLSPRVSWEDPINGGHFWDWRRCESPEPFGLEDI